MLLHFSIPPTPRRGMGTKFYLIIFSAVPKFLLPLLLFLLGNYLLRKLNGAKRHLLDGYFFHSAHDINFKQLIYIPFHSLPNKLQSKMQKQHPDFIIINDHLIHHPQDAILPDYPIIECKNLKIFLLEQRYFYDWVMAVIIALIYLSA